ncbi:hypothetical protein CIP107509_00283 [Corynebacterium diphtheriae]|uniref:Uncharacterized protein n=1 Tax=Corynebacterium diphtheriae TaxID=1717 RepID=A0A811G8J0_CORDP|nr:hypothetical protein CIP107509_00283 [Corynebacterium diphtheriae]CAB0583703.1 hypothetical protein CIP107547_00375 [Corynebacterium diphtheriae]
MTVGRSSSLRMTWSRNTLGCPHVGHSLMGSASMTMAFGLGCTVGPWLWMDGLDTLFLQSQGPQYLVPRPNSRRANQCTLKPEEPPNGGISKDFAQNFTPNRFQTGRLTEFGVKCRLFGGERGWRAYQRPPMSANPSQAMVVKTSHSTQCHARTLGELINAL